MAAETFATGSNASFINDPINLKSDFTVSQATSGGIRVLPESPILNCSQLYEIEQSPERKLWRFE
jgi:hypothetical protein